MSQVLRYPGRWPINLLIAANLPSTLRSFLLPFAQHYRSLGWRVDAMANGVTECPECLQAFDRVFEVPWSRSPLDPKNLLLSPRIRRIVTAGDYDLVHAHNPVPAFVTRYALRDLRRRRGFKVIYTAHGFHFFKGNSPAKNAIFVRLERMAGHWTDHLVVINREDEEAAKRYHIVPPGRVHYMPGIGVDTRLYNGARVGDEALAKVRKELALQPEEKLFLMVAEFIPRKRHRDALTAFAALKRDHARLAFAGVGPSSAEMERLAASLGIADRVHFLGYRRDIPALLRTATATLLPSAQEGLPRCVMESLSLGTPVIATAIRGVTELLSDGCGLMVEVGDTAAMTRAMAHILDHPKEARSMAKRAQARMKAYDLRHIIELHDTLYGKALGVELASV